jgi:PBP1b-binding outer membrane lipoprotein LpoB
MGFLNKIYKINLILLLVFLITSCEKPKQEIINEASKQEKSIELPTFQEISSNEIEKFDGIYNFGYNDNTFTQKFDETGNMQWSYLYNCAQIDSKSKTLIIQLTKNTDKLYFDIKKKVDTRWLFISKSGFMEGDLERSYGEHL